MRVFLYFLIIFPRRISIIELRYNTKEYALNVKYKENYRWSKVHRDPFLVDYFHNLLIYSSWKQFSKSHCALITYFNMHVKLKS